MNGCFHGVKNRKLSLSIIGIFSGSVLGYFVLMACTPAESVRNLLVLLDLSAAFDTIDHDILIDRLQNYTGIQGQALRWFRSYLSDRYHFVYLNGESSQLSPVKYGVPQGSVLAPLLFSLYMLPLGNIIRKYGISFHC